VSDVKPGASWLPDAIMAVLIFLAGAAVGGAYRRVFVASGAPEEFGVYKEFGPAVALACGRGFVGTGDAPTPAVGEFLLHKRDRMTCADLPPTIPPQPLDITQGLYRYLIAAAGLVWAVSGSISWNGLTPLFAITYGATVTAAYGIFRLGIGRVMSVAATLAVLLSAIHLGYLPYLRDYSKAPFALTLILIMGRLATGPLTWKRAIGYGAAFGLVLGIGFGFRNDLLINVVPWAAVVLLCLPGNLRANLDRKAVCLAVSTVVFLITARPILSAYSNGSNSGHVALLGLMTAFDGPLGLAGSVYDWGYFYNDGFAYRLINSFTYRQYGHPVAYLSSEYDRAMVEYVLRIVRHFPADFVARVYGSVLKILEMPFTVGSNAPPVPHGIHHPVVLAIYSGQKSMLDALTGMGTVMAILTLLVISSTSVRAAAILVVFLVYFAGYPAIQFSVRHYFHLEFIGWWALAFLIDRTAISLWQRVRQRSAPRITAATPPVWSVVRRALSFAVLVAATAAGLLMTLRWYQAAHVRRLIERSYLGAEREPIEIVRTPAGAGRVLFDASAVWNDWNRSEAIGTAYIVAEFSTARCAVHGAANVVATFRYRALDPNADYSHDVTVRLLDGDQPTIVFFPALAVTNYSHFQGIELPASVADCLARISRVRKDRIPDVLLDATLTPHWRQAKLYATMAVLEEPNHGEEVGPALYMNPLALRVPVARPAPFVPPQPDFEYVAPFAHKGPDASLLIRGRDDARFSLVMSVRQQPLPAGAIVMARGDVRKGGITLGLLGSDNAWATYVNVTSPGPFVAAVSAPRDDTYILMLVDCIPMDWIERHVPARVAEWLVSKNRVRRENDVVVTALGWFPPPETGGAGPVY
jgi:hypothetical protein